MSSRETKSLLLATLGGQPQVVTFTLDLLLARGIPIQDVLVVHPVAYPNIQRSIDRLSAEFPGDIYTQTGQKIRLRRYALRYYDSAITDITDEQSANHAVDAMDQLISDLKRQQHNIHFSITGGRRLMGYLSLSAAMLNFGSADHVWHIHTPEELKQNARNGAIMHADPIEAVSLIEVPFARMAQPFLPRLLSTDPSNTQQLRNEQEARERAEQQKRCRTVVERISPTQRKVLEAFARGLDPQSVASALERDIKTVNSHKTVVLRECRNVWEIDPKKHLDYHFIEKMFASYPNIL